MANSPTLNLTMMSASERKRAYNREWFAKNPERLKEYRKAQYAKNRDKVLSANAKWRAGNMERVRATNRKAKLKQNYGLTPDEVAALKEAQGHACALCLEVKPLNVDHSHSLGKVRGMLCTSCNTSLGKFKHDPALLRAAADYIEAHRK